MAPRARATGGAAFGGRTGSTSGATIGGGAASTVSVRSRRRKTRTPTTINTAANKPTRTTAAEGETCVATKDSSREEAMSTVRGEPAIAYPSRDTETVTTCVDVAVAVITRSSTAIHAASPCPSVTRDESDAPSTVTEAAA